MVISTEAVFYFDTLQTKNRIGGEVYRRAKHRKLLKTKLSMQHNKPMFDH